MRSRGVKALVVIALPILYAILFFHGTRLVGHITAPLWWVVRFPSNLYGAFTWYSLWRIAAITIVAVPIGVICTLAFPRRTFIAAATTGCMAFMLGRANFLFSTSSSDILVKLSLLLELIPLVAVPLIVAKLLHSNPSLERP
ncbi:MAG: hypothetical protein IT482_04505 [Gammaproteobacteria bacterium]|nr:hypothetical protein [Gammaproteobacteria bacterium]